MLTSQQFDQARQFIYRHGRLLDRKRFAYHFEGGTTDAVTAVLACYQNPDGGFGHGLEPDILCPASSGICTEVALFLLAELGVREGPIVDGVERWAESSLSDTGLPHPIEEIKRYPHGPWWANPDRERVFSVAGLLAKLGRGSDAFHSRVAERFGGTPFPQDIGVYSYPFNLYLRYAPQAGQFAERLDGVRRAFPAMLAKEAWHCPLLIGAGWQSDDIDTATWRSEAAKAVATLQADGGVAIERYAGLSWWRPVWTLDLLVTVKQRRLLDGAVERLTAHRQPG